MYSLYKAIILLLVGQLLFRRFIFTGSNYVNSNESLIMNYSTKTIFQYRNPSVTNDAAVFLLRIQHGGLLTNV